MAELTQDELQSIARSYFRDRLIDGNDRIFWIEDMHGNSDEDRTAGIEAAANREARLRELDSTGAAADLFRNAVSVRLARQGLQHVTPGSDSHGILQSYFVRAEIEGSRILRAKLQKDYKSVMPLDPLYAGIMDDTLPPLPEFGLSAPNADQSLGDLVVKFTKTRQASWEYKTRLDFQRVLGWLMEYHGKAKPIKSITTPDVGGFRDTLLKIPKNYTKGKGNSGLTLMEAIASMAEADTISPQTAEKYLNMARTFFNWCGDEGHIDKVPGQKIGVDYKVTEKARLPFTDDQLSFLFASPLWSGCHSKTKRSKPGKFLFKNAYYWIPLVAAYTGMRCGEIVQLRHMDILTSEGIPYFDVNDDHQKKLKTKYSRRRIPIHPRLKDWGFLDFVKGRAGTPTDRIFHEISISTNGDPSNAFSKVFARYLKDIGLKNKQLTFHSFRHTVPDALDNASVPEAHKHAMMGHSDGSASAGYGTGAAIPVLFVSINKISYSFEKTFDPSPSGYKIIAGN